MILVSLREKEKHYQLFCLQWSGEFSLVKSWTLFRNSEGLSSNSWMMKKQTCASLPS